MYYVDRKIPYTITAGPLSSHFSFFLTLWYVAEAKLR